MALPPSLLGHRVRCRPYSIVLEGGKWRRRYVAARSANVAAASRPCPASGRGQAAARDELGDEAERVAFSARSSASSCYGLGSGSDRAREAALPVERVSEPLPTALIPLSPLPATRATMTSSPMLTGAPLSPSGLRSAGRARPAPAGRGCAHSCVRLRRPHPGRAQARAPATAGRRAPYREPPCHLHRSSRSRVLAHADHLPSRSDGSSSAMRPASSMWRRRVQSWRGNKPDLGAAADCAQIILPRATSRKVTWARGSRSLILTEAADVALPSDRNGHVSELRSRTSRRRSQGWPQHGMPAEMRDYLRSRE